MVVSTLSLVDEWAVGFLYVAILFLFFVGGAACPCSTVFLVGMSVWRTGPGGNRVYSMVYYAMSVVRFDHFFRLHLR